MDLLLAIVLIVLAFLGGALGGMYLVRKQIEKKNSLTTHVWMLKQFVLFWVQMVKNQAKLRYNKFTTKSSANKRQPLTIKKKNK